MAPATFKHNATGQEGLLSAINNHSGNGKRMECFVFLYTELVERICNPDGDYKFGPSLTDPDIPDGLTSCIRQCFSSDPGDRPSVNSIMRTINKNNPFK